MARGFLEGSAWPFSGTNLIEPHGGIRMHEIKIIIEKELLLPMLSDLGRSHHFAYERVGFVYCDFNAKEKTLTARAFVPVADEDYLRDRYVGACIGTRPIRNAICAALSGSAAVFHVHIHDHFGLPFFSRVDEKFYEELVPALRAVNPQVPHGAFVFSKDGFRARLWGSKGLAIDQEFIGMDFSKEEK